MSEYMKNWKLKNPTYFKDYGIENREKLTAYHDEWVKNNLDEVKQYQRTYYEEWRLNNKTSKTKLKQKKIENDLKKLKEKADKFKASLI